MPNFKGKIAEIHDDVMIYFVFFSSTMLSVVVGTVSTETSTVLPSSIAGFSSSSSRGLSPDPTE